MSSQVDIRQETFELGILLPRNDLKFPLVKVMVNKNAVVSVFELGKNQSHFCF